MSLDERLFGWLYRSLRPGRGPELGAGAAHLEELSPRLELVASALASSPLSVRASEDIGGVRGATLLLPQHIDLAADETMNLAAYLYRVAYAVASRVLGFTTEGLPELAGGARIAALLAVPATRARVDAELPNAPALYGALLESALDAEPDVPKKVVAEIVDEARGLLDVVLGRAVAVLPPGGVAAALRDEPPLQPAALVRFVETHHRALERIGPAVLHLGQPSLILFGRLFGALDAVGEGDAPDESQGAPAAAGATEHEAPRRDEVELIELPKSRENENPLVHSFEKVHTLDDYQGGSKRHDGEDQLDEQLAALDELDLRNVVRTPEPSQAVLKLDGLFEGFAGEVADSSNEERDRPHFSYDEWDAAKRRYRSDWCTLFLERPPRPIEAEAANQRMLRVRREHAAQIRELRAFLEALELERRWRNRQIDGTEIDLEALVDRRAALLAGRTPDDRVYASRRRHERELATLVLLDLSLSSDSYIDDRRILDVARDTVMVLGEVLDASADHFAVAGFQSHTRQECRWLPMKSFSDPWSLAARRMLAVEPAGYTRIGPALRHGIRVLSEHPAQRRLLLLVTDAKPTDYDRYEGRYGMDDVRQAFREAEGQEVHPFAVTISESNGSTLPRMFGSGRYEVLDRPDELPAALTQVYTRLAR